MVFLYGVSKFLFSALALAFSLSLLASFVVAMTVIPLFCSRFLKQHAPAEGGAEHPVAEHPGGKSLGDRFNAGFNRGFGKVLDYYERSVRRAVVRPGWTVLVLAAVFVLSLGIYPFCGVAFFPRTDAGQFTINMKVPTGTRIEVTEQYVKKVEDLIHRIVGPHDFKMVVSNIGVVDDFTALYTDNAGEYTSTVQVALNGDHDTSSFDYIARVRKAIAAELPDVRTFFQSGSMVDAIINSGMRCV